MKIEQQPIIFGHENLGTVEKIGLGDTDIKLVRG
jgi:Zn-dependent alcohol dehydrogenase